MTDAVPPNDPANWRRPEIEVEHLRDASVYRCLCHGWHLLSNWRRHDDHRLAIEELQERHRAAGLPIPEYVPPPRFLPPPPIDIWDVIQ